MYYSKEQLEQLRKKAEEYAKKIEEEAEAARKDRRFESAAGIPIVCPHCHHDHFHQGKALLNTRGLTFFDLEWLNDSAITLMCVKCGHIQWFGIDVKPL
jgi:hypothetical protein